MKKVSAPSMRCFRTGSSCRDATGPGAGLEAEPVLKETAFAFLAPFGSLEALSPGDACQVRCVMYWAQWLAEISTARVTSPFAATLDTVELTRTRARVEKSMPMRPTAVPGTSAVRRAS